MTSSSRKNSKSLPANEEEGSGASVSQTTDQHSNVKGILKDFLII